MMFPRARRKRTRSEPHTNQAEAGEEEAGWCCHRVHVGGRDRAGDDAVYRRDDGTHDHS